jgi:hypothetical protein
VQIWIGEQIGPHTWALGATDADWTSIENSGDRTTQFVWHL